MCDDAGEYVASPCGRDSELKCLPCNACDNKRKFVNPSGMCSGYNNVPVQDCATCRSPATCPSEISTDNVVLNLCASGHTSYDSTTCIPRSIYRSPLDFECSAGYYLRSFSPSDADPDTTHAGLVYNSPDDAMLARVLNTELLLLQTESASAPMTASKTRPPSIRVWLSSVDKAALKYTFTVAVLDQNQFSFVHPMGSVLLRPLDLGDLVPQEDKVISTGVWSHDSRTFFLVWMDGTVSRAVVSPEVRERIHFLTHHNH